MRQFKFLVCNPGVYINHPVINTVLISSDSHKSTALIRSDNHNIASNFYIYLLLAVCDHI